jgi:hypothetical protein
MFSGPRRFFRRNDFCNTGLYHDIVLCRLISDDMIAVETVCLWTVDVCYCGGCVPLIVTMCHRLSIRVLLGVVVYHWIVVMYYYG